MPCAITIYKASHPAVDPNIIQDCRELREEGYSVFPANRVRMDMECVHEYGDMLRAKRRIFNFPKIKDDYGFSSIPRPIIKTDNGIMFSDKSTTVEIDREIITERYLLQETIDAFVVDLEKLFSFENIEDMYKELSDCLLEERNMHPCNAAYYSMTIQQVCIINKYVPPTHLFKFFERGKSPLYIQFTQYSY